MMESLKNNLDILTAGSWAIFDHLFEIEKLPESGDTVNILSPVEDIGKIYWGGCSYNSAVVAAKLGLRAGVQSVEGEDFITSGYQDYLVKLGIDLSGMIILDGRRSGHGFLFADPDGNAIIVGNPGSALEQKNCHPNQALIASSKAVVVAPTFDEFTLPTLRIAKKSNVLSAVNGSLATWPDVAASFVANADILFGNYFEFHALTKIVGVNSERELLSRGPKVLYVTKGSQGVRLLTSDRECEIPAVSVKEFVDPVGAGDAFVGATMSGILLGLEYEIAGRLGATVASFVVEDKGSQANLPDWKAVQSRYEEFFRVPLPPVKEGYLMH